MEKLDKVIAGLKFCVGPDTVCEDSDCPYHGKRDCDAGWVCVDFLMADALNLLNDLRYDNQRLREMWADAEKKLSILRAELAEERERSARWLRESEPVIHAHWIHGGMCSHCETYFSVNVDGEDVTIYEMGGVKRCPECGAHMDEEVEE